MFFINFSNAQTNSPVTTVEQKTTNLMNEIKSVITLTDEQSVKITQFVTDFFTQKDVDDAKYKNSGEEQISNAAKLRRQTLISNLKSVLTEQQFTLVDEHWKNKKPSGNNTETH